MQAVPRIRVPNRFPWLGPDARPESISAACPGTGIYRLAAPSPAHDGDPGDVPDADLR